jgi:hypothetical protein
MTQLLAIKSEKWVALAADTHTLVGPPGGRFEPGDPEEKLVIIGKRYGVMTYGTGPSDHVPTAIKKLSAESNICDMAGCLLDHFRRYEPPPKMGILG